ncbi:dienelactone hydrolase family protein [Microbacterium sp. 18062]|uniref:dienelactone hydrolase family protein n=1 Tax=Microbacterium sp. 18062 TaxID=2681410 RepID=UPI00135B6467|nr:dienelactone hydrolase family protein [Microbacterium sp. 18062]
MSIEDLPENLQHLLTTVSPRHDRPIAVHDVEYLHGATPLRGFIAEPEGGSPKAVLVFHAWMGPGPYVEARARMIAGLGYTVFAGDVYGDGVRPATIPEMRAESQKYYADLPLMRGRAQAAFDALTDRGFTPDDILVIGYCFGGTVALEHARTGQRSAGVVSFHGRLITQDPPEVQAIAAPVLILTGGSDPIAPDEDVKAFADELRTAPEVDWQISVYSGAPHAFTVPGDMYREKADARSWRAFVDFADEVAPIV